MVTVKVPATPMKKRTKATIAKLVDAVINRRSETKFISTKVQVNVLHNSGIAFADVSRVLPRVPQGEQEWERLGDSIKPSSLIVRGLVSMNRTAAVDNRVLLVRVCLLSAKNLKCFTDFTSGNLPINRLLRVNDETGTETIAYTGDPNDVNYKINKELFTVHMDKTYRIASIQSPAPTIPGSLEQNPDSYFRFQKTIECPATLKYDDSKGTDPTNFAPFFVIGYSFADGTGPDTVGTRIIANVTSTLSYKDF